MGAEPTALELARGRHDYAVSLRRWFHRHPEPSARERATSDRVARELEALGIRYERAGATSIVARLPGEGGAPVVALRADMDALEIEEANEVPYRSESRGLMHACGHDGHVAALLAAASALVGDGARGRVEVALIFQAAEEIGKGAQEVIESGLVDDVRAFFGIHATPFAETGQVALRAGPIMAGANSLVVELEGRSSHGARPDLGVDAVVAGSAIVQALQEVVAREADPVEPAVVTVGTFNAGTRANIIANRASLSGTLRAMSEEKRASLSAAVVRVAERVAEAYRVKARVECEYATPIVVNSPELFPVARAAAVAAVGEASVIDQPLSMGTDDFARFSAIGPAFYATVGVHGGGERYPLHHERFDLDEDALDVMAALHIQFVREYAKAIGGSVPRPARAAQSSR
jgi:amidohydrolase